MIFKILVILRWSVAWYRINTLFVLQKLTANKQKLKKKITSNYPRKLGKLPLNRELFQKDWEPLINQPYEISAIAKNLLKVKAFSQNFGKFNCKRCIVRIGQFGRFLTYSSANGHWIFAILYSNRNLVKHFYKILNYISWFHDTQLWEGLGAGPYT